MSVQTEIDRIITAVGAAYDAVEEKGGTLPTSETVANLAEAISSIPKETHQGSASETWVLNKATEFPLTMQFAVNFNSNGKSFTSISAGTARLLYGTTIVASAEPAPGAVLVTNAWPEEAFRKLVFDEAPTGDLLTWLEANGVKQPANLAVQPSKDVTVTSNGTTEITPDAPYDVMEKANLTVYVPTGGSADMRTINIIVDGQSVSDIADWAVTCWYGADNVTLDSETPSVSISVPNQTIFVISVTSDILVDVSGADEGILFDILGVSGDYLQLQESSLTTFTYVCCLDATVEDSSFTLTLSLSKNSNS